MKLIRQTTLYYREGSSDKVYEVDLCEVSPGRYLVNFRYGRRGSTLKEGTKTTSAVPLTQAQRLFSELVNEKVKKGYSETIPQAPVSPKQNPLVAPVRSNVPIPTLADPRSQAVLNHLASFRATGKKPKWPIERVIWRAGELKIREATPFLINLIGNGTSLRDYCIAWSLGWCGDETAVSSLGRLYGDIGSSDSVRRIAAEALLKLSDEETQKEFRNDMIERLPAELRDSARSGSSEKFSHQLRSYLKTDHYSKFEVLEMIYLIDNEYVRPALLEILRTCPLKPNYFQRLRHIFKAAEYRHDAEVFGILAYRFEKEQEMFTSSKYSKTVYIIVNGTYENINKSSLRNKDSRIAYSNSTRMYFRKRIWRTLKRLADLGNTDYVKMAVGILLAFSDKDAQPARENSFYDWQTRSYKYTRYDKYANYLAFNHILYGNSTRYMPSPARDRWRCRPNYKPGEAEPNVREESFPKLWESVPTGLLHLLSESNCQVVHHFAVKALRSCKEFCSELDIEVLLMLLSRPYSITAELGFDLSKARYNPANPDYQLVLALANSSFQPARAQAYSWIDENRHNFSKNKDFIVSLITSPQRETRIFASNFLRSCVFSDTLAQDLSTRLINYLLTLKADHTNQNVAEEAKDIADTIFKNFAYLLVSLDLDIILKLLANPILEVQELGGNILLNHQVKANSLPESLIFSLMNSPYEPMRGIGVRLLGQLSDESLLSKESLLLSLCLHTLADIRNSVRPIVGRLAHISNEFGQKLGLTLIDKLLAIEAIPKLHSYIVNLLRSELNIVLKTLEWDLVLKLTKSPSAVAQEMAGIILQANPQWANHYKTEELIALSNNELQAVRIASQELFKNAISRFQNSAEEMAMSIRFLDCKWDEERQNWFKIFDLHFTSEHFTPVILVSICDSTRLDVQKFGRDMILKYFSSESGPDYLMKLSEHPSHNMQLFVTNYLEEYASNNAQRLKELAPYFIRVLAAINKAHFAKERVLNFLEQEAQKDINSAEVVAEILTRQSVTIAITDRARSIEAMLKIHQTYPQVILPIKVKSLEVRRGI
ncbi:MAG: WGR domain-containing protein [Acidobacteria bacterium]|nr:WGR domain-containing protein [Acidobacteriota bacterium]